MELEDIFRLNHLDAIQELYEKIREHFEAHCIYDKFSLQDFIDFCLENSYVEEIKWNNEQSEC